MHRVHLIVLCNVFKLVCGIFFAFDLGYVLCQALRGYFFKSFF